jgi:hypothetical protein
MKMPLHESSGDSITTTANQSGNDSLNLECDCDKIGSLLQLLSDKLEHLAKVDPSEFRGDDVASFLNGVALMVMDARSTLKRIQVQVGKAAIYEYREEENKIGKFIKVNLSSNDYKRLRKAAKALGGELRGYIKYNLHSLMSELEERAKLQRILGMNGSEQYKFFAVRSGLN